MTTKVAFRKFSKMDGGDVIALFPDERWSDYCDCISSYMHVGQHASASPELLTELEVATPEEYADLLTELKYLVGYDDLIVVD